MHKYGNMAGLNNKWAPNSGDVNIVLYQKILPEKNTSAAIELEATGQIQAAVNRLLCDSEIRLMPWRAQ